MAKPVVTSVTPVNVNGIIGADLQARIKVDYTHNDANDLWFRFDLIPGSHSPVEGTWEKVNKAGGSVTLTYKRSGVSSPGIPSNWQDATRISTQLVWGEGGHGAGALVKRYANMFTTQQAVTAGTTGTRPTIKSVLPVKAYLYAGDPAQVKVKYDSPVASYLRFDLKPDKGLSYLPPTWVEGTYQHIEAGTNKEVILTFANMPSNWNPSTPVFGAMSGINGVDAQIVYSNSGTGRGGLLKNQRHVFWILSPGQEAPEPTTTGTGPMPVTPAPVITPTPTPTPTPAPTDTTAIGGLIQWLKDNWIVVALIGGILLLVVPGGSSKQD